MFWSGGVPAARGKRVQPQGAVHRLGGQRDDGQGGRAGQHLGAKWAGFQGGFKVAPCCCLKIGGVSFDFLNHTKENTFKGKHTQRNSQRHKFKARQNQSSTATHREKQAHIHIYSHIHTHKHKQHMNTNAKTNICRDTNTDTQTQSHGGDHMGGSVLDSYTADLVERSMVCGRDLQESASKGSSELWSK